MGSSRVVGQPVGQVEDGSDIRLLAELLPKLAVVVILLHQSRLRLLGA